MELNDFHDIRKLVEEYGYTAHYRVVEKKIKTNRDDWVIGQEDRL